MTPSQFYKQLRPENFSDSDTTYQNELPKEHLAYELNQISTNQKQDEFESLARRLAEKFISPNLVPQVGPTGGGDGKTDSETYPVSEFISSRWYIPENGWNNNEKWAFAISAKQEWKGKLKKDIKSIISTNRAYNRIYFISNQQISSKKKKDAQDEFIKEFGIDIIILDGEWILEKIYNNDLIELAVDSLNLSDIYKNKVISLGSNDVERIKKLRDIEEKITNPNRYFEIDFQLVEDALQAALLSRMLEKSREEIEGKFDRAIRFCEKLNNNKLWIRVLYQRAWTYIHWYDDYKGFASDFLKFKTYVLKEPSISDVELYHNLLNVLHGISAREVIPLSELGTTLEHEMECFFNILKQFEDNDEKPCSSLIAKTYRSIQFLMSPQSGKSIVDDNINNLSKYLNNSTKYLDYPFESICKIVEVFGPAFASNPVYDDLIDTVAMLSEKRYSELAAGEVYVRRGGQKLSAKLYKESVVYFGKAVVKLAKEESKYGMYLSLIGLSNAYENMGLVWASNNCLVSATSISIRPFYEKGKIDRKLYACVKQLVNLELLIGRIPIFLCWHELLLVLRHHLDNIDNGEPVSSELLDGCFAVRLLNTKYEDTGSLALLPDLLESQSLWISQNSVLYWLGHTDLIMDDYKKTEIQDEAGLDNFFQLAAHQPFNKQIIYNTDFLDGDSNKISSRILGCIFNIHYPADKELHIAAETIMAYFESFLATSLKEIIPSVEQIDIKLLKNESVQFLKFANDKSSNKYSVEINKLDFKNGTEQNAFWEQILVFSSNILAKNFIIRDAAEYLENLFKKEEVHERISMVFEHRKLLVNILGEKPKLFFNDWIVDKSFNSYPLKRETKLIFPVISSPLTDENSTEPGQKPNFDNATHNNQRVSSIIDVTLWDSAVWKGFGFFGDAHGMGVFLAFENGEAGKQIFENWIKTYGHEDKDDVIRLAIIKGVNKDKPFYYNVHVSKNIEEKLKEDGGFFISASRFNEITPNNPTNLNNLIAGWDFLKKYRLIPAQMLEGGRVEPYFDKAIIKTSLVIKNAWEIGENDLDQVVILPNSNPVIPFDVKDAPVLKVLENKKTKL
jgi:hypothetical protein